MKKMIALLAALLVTACVGVGMFALGGSALINRPTAAQAAVAPGDANVQQLQDLVSQYQQREKQYQAELDSARQQIQAASGDLAQYQNLIQALQERGVIRIDREGRILVPGRAFRGGQDFDTGDD